ncbi:MAG: hypothetical protein AAF677_07210 [Pseudomonadota bacterium]
MANIKVVEARQKFDALRELDLDRFPKVGSLLEAISAASAPYNAGQPVPTKTVQSNFSGGAMNMAVLRATEDLFALERDDPVWLHGTAATFRQALADWAAGDEAKVVERVVEAESVDYWDDLVTLEIGGVQLDRGRAPLGATVPVLAEIRTSASSSVGDLAVDVALTRFQLHAGATAGNGADPAEFRAARDDPGPDAVARARAPVEILNEGSRRAPRWTVRAEGGAVEARLMFEIGELVAVGPGQGIEASVVVYAKDVEVNVALPDDYFAGAGGAVLPESARDKVLAALAKKRIRREPDGRAVLCRHTIRYDSDRPLRRGLGPG